jgi:hypothetical protein
LIRLTGIACEYLACVSPSADPEPTPVTDDAPILYLHILLKRILGIQKYIVSIIY